MIQLLLIPVLLLTCFKGLEAGPQWDYNLHGPDHWPSVFEACKKNSQSPVNIDTSQVRYSGSLTPFHLKGYDSIPTNKVWTIKNNGMTVVITLNGEPYEIEDGGLKGTFRAAQFHFHWGKYDQQGAEHAIDMHFAPAELHIVHYNTKYPSLAEAADKPNGLAVLGYLFQVSESDNSAYDHLIKHLADVTSPDQSVDIKPVPLRSLLPATNLNNYFRYQGSLTTPPCYESVTWTVFKDKIDISKQQLRKFRSYLSSAISDNYRPVQELNDRIVLTSDAEDSTVFTSPMTSPFTLTVAASIGIILVMLFVRTNNNNNNNMKSD